MPAAEQSAPPLSNGHLENGRQAVGQKEASKDDDNGPYRLHWTEWLVQRFAWNWFTCTQSTGGIAILLSLAPHQFDGLQTIGTIIFIFNVVLFLIFTGLMVARWIIAPQTLKACFTKSPECYFFPSWWLTIATIIICMERFGVPNCGNWLIVTVRVLFWIYAACTLLSTIIYHVVIFKHTLVKSINMNPAWFLLTFQAMLTGTIAASIAMNQPPAQRVPIMVAGLAYQGLGWLTSMLYLAWFIGTLMENGWPKASMRPGLFMTVGSVGYTIVVFIGTARACPNGYGYFAMHPTASEVLVIVADWASIFMWLFGFWLFGLALVICLAEVTVRENGKWKFPMSYNNTWWALIFPNVGFTVGTIYIGQNFASATTTWVATGMTIALVLVWLLDLFLMAKTVFLSLFVDARKSV